MNRVGVIGDIDSAIGFGALGMTVAAASTKEEGAAALARLAKDGYAIVFITENLAAELQEEINAYRDSQLPAIILIPSASGGTGQGMRQLRAAVLSAVGIDILGAPQNGGSPSKE